MNKLMKETTGKTEQELVTSVQALRLEIAKMNVERSTTQPKNTNTISNKKRQLAVLLTVLRQKRDK